MDLSNQKITSLSLVGILGSSKYSLEKFKELYEEDDLLKTLALRVAVINCIPDAVSFLLDKNVPWNYHIETNTIECECISCSGKYYNCKELAFRLSYDVWVDANSNIKTLRKRIFDVQTQFAELEELTDNEINLFLYRHMKDGRKFLETKYSDERILKACSKHSWILNRINDEPLKELNREQVAKGEVSEFCNNLINDDYLEKCHDFVSKASVELRNVMAHAISARNCRAVQHLIDLGIFDYNIGNPFNYFNGPHGSFKRQGSDIGLVSMLHNFGFRPNAITIKMLLKSEDFETINLLLPFVEEPITLEDLDTCKEELFNNIEDASSLVYKILSS